MAWQKTKTLANGVSGSYWKITKLAYDRSAGKLAVALELFMDKAHATSFQNLGYTKHYALPITPAQAEGNLLAWAYTALMAQASTLVNAPTPAAHTVAAPTTATAVPPVKVAQDLELAGATLV